LFYISLGSFATGALIALFGTIVTISLEHGAFASLALVGLSGTIGVTALMMGCAMTVQETRIAIRTLADDRTDRHASIASERATPP
jgi:xanthine/uracil/vitamin C permease (AzgA family)